MGSHSGNYGAARRSEWAPPLPPRRGATRNEAGKETGSAPAPAWPPREKCARWLLSKSVSCDTRSKRCNV